MTLTQIFFKGIPSEYLGHSLFPDASAKQAHLHSLKIAPKKQALLSLNEM
jgi:hypothetical protein